MSLLDVDDEQRWVPTHVQVTVLRGRGLRAKGKSGTSDVYTIIQVGKEKFSTCVAEKTTAPEWKEECSFELLPGVLEPEGRSAYPAGSGDLVLTVMHRALIGLDVFLGQATIPLDKVFQDRICMKNEWYRLHSKSGKKEKERGEVQVTVQFTRHNLTASMYDLSAKDKPLSAFGRLKDRMRGKKRDDAEGGGGGDSASAIVPSSGGGGLAVPAVGRRARLPSDGGGEEEYEDDEGGEGRRSKMRSFFLRGKLRKSSDTRSSASLGSESSESSSRGGSLSPTAGISVVVSDLSNSPSETSNLTADNSPEHTTLPSPNHMTHKRAFSYEAGLAAAAAETPSAPLPPPHPVQSLKARGSALSQSSLCVNGSHVYAAEPLLPPSGNAVTTAAALGLHQKHSPISRSLQNLARRADEPPAKRGGPGAEGRRWSFDKPARDGTAGAMTLVIPTLVLPAATAVAAGEPAAEGKRQRKNGRSDSAGKGAEQPPAPPPAEEKHKGWFGSKDSHNKPSPEVSPKVETCSDTVTSHPLTPSPDNPSRTTGPASVVGLASPGLAHLANPFTPSPGSPTISPSNPFFTRLQCNPFFVDLLGDHALKSAPPAPCLSSSSFWPSTVSSALSDPSRAWACLEAEPGLAAGVASERSHLVAPGRRARASPNPFITPPPLSEDLSEWDSSFEEFAAGRLGLQTGPAPPAHAMTLPPEPAVDDSSARVMMNVKSTGAEEGSPSFPRRSTKIPVPLGRQSQRFDWTQEPGVKKDLFPQPQIEVSSWECDTEELGRYTPVPSWEGKTDVGLFSEWDPEKPLDRSVSSPQFVSVRSLIPNSASAGQPIVSPSRLGGLGVASENAAGEGGADEVQQEGEKPGSVFHTCEGVGRENNFVGNEELCKISSFCASFPQFAAEESKISTYETDVFPIGTGTNPFLATAPSHKLSETHLVGQEGSTTDALKPVNEAAVNLTSTNTKIPDLPQVTTNAARDSLHESYAHIFNFADSALPNTDTSGSLSVMTVNNTEISNNSTNELVTSPSPFTPEVVMNDSKSKKPGSLFSKVLESLSTADMAGLPTIGGNSLSDSNEGTLLESVSDVSANAAGSLPESPPVSGALVEAPAGSPALVDEEDEVLSEKDEPEKRSRSDEALEEEQSHTSTATLQTISRKLDIVPQADKTSDNALEGCTVARDAVLRSDSGLNAVGADSAGKLHQENCAGNSANLNVKDSSSTYAEMNGSTLSEYLEARESGPPLSPVSDTLNFVTAIEAPDTGYRWESRDAPSSDTEFERLPPMSRAGDTAAAPEDVEITPSFCTADSLTSAPETFPLEKLFSDPDVSQPPPKPPRLFHDSSLNEQHVSECPRPLLGDQAETVHPGTPKDSSTCPSLLSSVWSDLSATSKSEWEKTGAKCQSATFTIWNDEPSSGKEVQRSYDLEASSNQSWLTSKSNFKVKELDLTNIAVWSADEENAIQTDSTSLDKVILMGNPSEGNSAQLMDVGTRSPGSPVRKLSEGLGESYLDQLKGTRQGIWTESFERTWQSMPSLSGFCSTLSQDLVIDLPPEDLQKPPDEEMQPVPSADPLDPVLLTQLRPSNPSAGSDAIALPKGIKSAIDLKEAEGVPTPKLHPPVGVNPKSSLFLHDCNPLGTSTPSLLAETNAQVAFFPSPNLPPRSTAEPAQASSIAPPSKPPMIDTPLAVLPEETQTAGGLPSDQLSSPHLVKPLNNTAAPEEKKSEGRSVLASGLEKLKSTIHPGRATHQGEPEADRDKALSEGAAPYYHLSHTELVSLLLQREGELERQGAEFARQGALLAKREAELKKMKLQTRDLEDYIDTLLVRIMEQTPTLLQVRTKLK